ncbi:oxidase ustYa family protein [Aspergillus stella-maris]|uniref:oxidase ustYa family protein n=1 Tax=Aspergillus stella-maris TaxID=1810926 RepID=UPI003CCE2807
MGFSGTWLSFQRIHKVQVLDSGDSDGHDHSDMDTEGLLSAGKKAGRQTFTLEPPSKSWVYFTAANLILSSIVVCVALYTRESTIKVYQKNAILRPVSWWSPILDAVDIPTYKTTLNGTLFAIPEHSIAREEPGPENDASWEQYETIFTHIVSRKEILKLGKDPDTVARFEDEYWGLGDDAYMVQLDVMHQIHCLNILRKAAFATYPGYKPPSDKGSQDPTYWIHLSHCVDILLQNLQCNANTEVLTLSWVEDRAAPWPDFSVNRQCRDFSIIVDWQRGNAVNSEKFGKMTRPKGAFVWPSPWKGSSELGVRLGEKQLHG